MTFPALLVTQKRDPVHGRPQSPALLSAKSNFLLVLFVSEKYTPFLLLEKN